MANDRFRQHFSALVTRKDGSVLHVTNHAGFPDDAKDGELDRITNLGAYDRSRDVELEDVFIDTIVAEGSPDPMFAEGRTVESQRKDKKNTPVVPPAITNPEIAVQHDQALPRP